MGHQQRVQRMGELLVKLQAALEVISQGPQTPGMDAQVWKEKLKGYQEKLKQIQSGEKKAWPGWLVPAIGAFIWGFILFRWYSR
jgi:hypothetical protein